MITWYMECGSLKSMVLKWECYLIPISSEPSISDITTSKFRIFSKNLTIFMNIYIICCCERLGEHYWALLKHDYSISTEFSYQIPPNQGFLDHYFELRELQGIMQHFSYKFHSLRFLLNKTSNIYHSYQILISDPPDQGFQGHYFKLKELQDTMQHFSYKFRSFRFQSN